MDSNAPSWNLAITSSIHLIKAFLMSRTSPPKCFGELEQGKNTRGKWGAHSHGVYLESEHPAHSKSAFQWDIQLHIPDVETEA